MIDPAPGRTASTSKRQYLTVLFSDLSDSTRLAGAMEAEHYAELLTELREISHAVIAKHGGTLVRMQGDGLLAIFGHPMALEDDGRRAVEAALELHARVRQDPLDVPLPPGLALTLHSGIHAGLLLVEPGDMVRGRFEIVGDAANVASRLSDAAAADEILVSEETLGPAGPFFETAAMRRLFVKGKTEALDVVPVLGRAASASRFEARRRRGLTPFVGRDHEIGLFDTALDEVLAGAARHLLVVAPAGTGKTRWVDECLQRALARGARVHRGDCESYLGAEPLQPLLQILRDVMGLRPGMPPALAGEVLDLALQATDPSVLARRAPLRRLLSLPVEGDDAATRSASGPPGIEALTDWLLALAKRQPLVLFIDDWQWSDDATRQAFSSLRGAIEAAPGLPLLLLVATRPTDTDPTDIAGTTVIPLAALDDDAAAQTIAGLLPRIDPFVQDEIRNHAGGNPLFIEELCHSASHEPTDRHARRVHGGPAWLDSLIQSRIERLPPAQADLVHTAAVIGNLVPAWLLQRLTGLAEDHPTLRALADQDLLFPDDVPGMLRFKHGIARDVIYAAVGLQRKRALHLAVAEALDEAMRLGTSGAAHEALAYHYGSAGRPALAARHAELAGDRARQASALDRAKRHYRAALDAMDQLPAHERDDRRWLSVAQRFGLACVFDAARSDLEIFRRGAVLAAAFDDAASIAAAEYWLGYIHYALGEARPAAHHCERALASALRADAQPLAVQIRATLGQIRMASAQYDEARRLLDEAIAVKRLHHRPGRPAIGLAYSLTTQATVLGDLGEFDAAQACFQEALQAAGPGHHEVEASILGLRAAVLLWQGRWAEARAVAAQARLISHRVRSLYALAMNEASGAYAAWMIEGAPASLQTIQRSRVWLEAREGQLFASLLHGWWADGLASGGGDTLRLRHALAQALQRSRQGDCLGGAMAARALARHAAVQGDASGADRYLTHAMRLARTRCSAHEIAVTLCAQAQWGSERAAATDRLASAAEAFERMHMRWHLDRAQALRLRLAAA